MAQVKKSGVKEAILEAAFDLFSRRGYTPTTMAHIAKDANMTVANIYVYFDSKLAILYALYRPWLNTQLASLAESTRKFRTPRSRLRRIFIGIWGDIPAADHSFANALIEALAAVPEGAGKSTNFLKEVEQFISELMAESLPAERHYLLKDDLLSNVVWMAFDGFVINRRIGDTRNIETIADMMVDMVLGENESAPARRSVAGRTPAGTKKQASTPAA
ncbi:MAG: TetR/AcrR family transcriptional regulator [Pseudomonadota bacterium]